MPGARAGIRTMQRRLQTTLDPGRGAGIYLAAAAVLLTVHLASDPTGGGSAAGAAAKVAAVAAVAVAAACAALCAKGVVGVRAACLAVIAAGFAVSLSYAMGTDIYTRQHDVGLADGVGHLGYIMRLAKEGALPDSNAWQLYHTPLHHIVAAAWHRMGEWLGMGQARGLESLQYLTVFYQAAISVTAHRIYAKLGLGGTPLLAATALTALHPTSFLFSGSINNDALSLLLCVAAVYWVLRWHGSPKAGYAAVAAAFTGLAVMAKSRPGIIAIALLPLLAHRVAVGRGKAGRLRMLGHTALFGAVSLPIGLWHPIRSLVRFGQPLLYVPNPGMHIYTGDHAFASRFLTVPFGELFGRLYCSPSADYNVPVYLLKCSLFGEFRYEGGGAALPVAMVAVNACLAAVFLAAASALA
ncbi:MAG: hypothetical protein FWE70_08045, partial [Oscillospiraceae bacterium]|nr:hypothetical protein [Oscillospiraceae bacterium]